MQLITLGDTGHSDNINSPHQTEIQNSSVHECQQLQQKNEQDIHYIKM